MEEGLISNTRQVEQSGLTVGPGLYLAFGISSDVQHVVGMGASKSIMAVNRDPKAPIFRIAGLGIVGDATEILLHVVEALRFRGGKS